MKLSENFCVSPGNNWNGRKNTGLTIAERVIIVTLFLFVVGLSSLQKYGRLAQLRT